MVMEPETPREKDSAEFDAVLRELARPPVLRELATVSVAVPEVREGFQHAQHSARSSAHAPQVGALLEGRYRVLGVLGRGGMGVVLEAENLRTGKRVAIKWMGQQRGERSALALARFQREARAVAKIAHENVVDVYDVGDADGTPFLVMERLHGESLRARLERGVLSWGEARAVMIGVLRGVAAVHRAGVVHRDLKPDNIFLCSHGAGQALPKVLDFGIAAVREGAEDAMGSLTRTGTLLGTPSYMSYEQLTGGEVDPRSDVYALGVVLYELLAGRLPFEARTPAEIAVLQITKQPVRPSRYAPALRGQPEQLVLRALSHEPEARFQSVEEMLTALESDVSPSRARRWLAVIAALGLAGLASSYALLITPRAPHHEPSFVPVQGETRLAQGDATIEREPIAESNTEPAPKLVPDAAVASAPDAAVRAFKRPAPVVAPAVSPARPSRTQITIDDF